MTQDCSITLFLSPTKTTVMTTTVFQRATTVTGTDTTSGPGIEELSHQIHGSNSNNPRITQRTRKEIIVKDYVVAAYLSDRLFLAKQHLKEDFPQRFLAFRL